MWGGFPALAGAFAQMGRINVATLFVCAGCALLAAAQRRLSTPVRRIRRRVTSVSGVLAEGDVAEQITEATITAAPEGALRLMWIAMVALAIGLVISRWP
jgi:thioredoxin reductase